MTQDESDGRFVNYLSHFLVSLGCVSVSSRLLTPTTEHKFFTSGFVIEVQRDWYFVSAGHVFNDIAKHRHGHPELIHDFVIFSGFGTFTLDRELIRFRYRDPVFCIDRIEGLDFGAIRLSHNEQSRLKANGILPVEERMWDQALPAHFSEFALLGLPFQNMELTTPGTATLQPVYLRVCSLPDKPKHYAHHSDTMRYFQILEPTRMDLNISGMSGCPIFAFSHSDKSMSTLVCAVQSSWYSGPKLIAATDLRFAASQLREAIRQV